MKIKVTHTYDPLTEAPKAPVVEAVPEKPAPVVVPPGLTPAEVFEFLARAKGCHVETKNGIGRLVKDEVEGEDQGEGIAGGKLS